MRKLQSGVMLLEAMIAVLIFSFGVLGLVGMQAMAVGASRDAKYRVDADLLANDLVAQMRTMIRSPDLLGESFAGGSSSGGPAYTLWRDTQVKTTLPGVDLFPPTVVVNRPGVARTDTEPSKAAEATITVRWCAPGEPCNNGGAPHQYAMTVQIF